MQCPACGAENAGNADFCTLCMRPMPGGAGTGVGVDEASVLPADSTSAPQADPAAPGAPATPAAPQADPYAAAGPQAGDDAYLGLGGETEFDRARREEQQAAIARQQREIAEHGSAEAAAEARTLATAQALREKIEKDRARRAGLFGTLTAVSCIGAGALLWVAFNWVRAEVAVAQNASVATGGALNGPVVAKALGLGVGFLLAAFAVAFTAGRATDTKKWGRIGALGVLLLEAAIFAPFVTGMSSGDTVVRTLAIVAGAIMSVSVISGLVGASAGGS